MTSPTVQVTNQPSPLFLIDDDRSLATLAAEYCLCGSISIPSALSGEDEISLAGPRYFELIILGVMAPGTDGLKVLEWLRRSSKTPILMPTVRGAATDRVHGLESGADDKLAKDLPEELVALIETTLWKIYAKDIAPQSTIGDLTVDELARSVTVGNRNLYLTGAEFHLLSVLLKYLGEPQSREELIPRIFAREPNRFDRSVDNLVNHLRKKLGPHPDGTERIKSVRNTGYC